MSGPKRYSFPAGSREEAAAISAQLSAFRHGVRVTVVNNNLEFEVSEQAWYQGADESAIADEIRRARQRYFEELKRLLEEKKERELKKMEERKQAIEKDLEAERSRLESSRNALFAAKREANISFNTPFGTYDLKNVVGEIADAEAKLSSEMSSLQRKADEALRSCEDAVGRIKRCGSMTELDSILRTTTGLKITRSATCDLANELRRSAQEKASRLKAYVATLDSMYEEMKKNDMLGYLDRIKREIASVDVFDAAAPKKLQAVISGIESEISVLKERERAEANRREIGEKVSAQLALLEKLKSSLKPLVDSIAVESRTVADYSERSVGIIRESEQIIARIRELDFVNGQNAATVNSIERDLASLRSSVRAEATVTKLQDYLTQLHELEEKCRQGNDDYRAFSEEYGKYEELYREFQGYLCADGSKIKEDAVTSPEDIFLTYEDPEEQIKELKEKNKQIGDLLNSCRQHCRFEAIAAAVQKGKSGTLLNEIRTKKAKGEDSLRLQYVRDDCKGALIDVECCKDGTIGMYPRGVILSSGKQTISPDELRKIHESCKWSEDLKRAFENLGMSNGGAYEEMSDDIRKAMYDLKNFYRFKTYDESVNFLRKSGYSQEEIDSLMGEEKKSGGTDTRTGSGIAENRAAYAER